MNAFQPSKLNSKSPREHSTVEILVPVEHADRARSVLGCGPCTTVRGFSPGYEGRTACFSVHRSRAFTAAREVTECIGRSVWVYLGGAGSHEVVP